MNSRSPITTHILDLSLGKPAAQVNVALEHFSGQFWSPIGKGQTNADGRCETLLPSEHPLTPGQYRMTFSTGEYFARTKVNSFYPSVSVTFEISDMKQHYHVPLLLSPYGYSTYRGS